MRSLECSSGLLNPRTHIKKQACVRAEAEVGVFGSVPSDAAGSPNVCLSVSTSVRAPAG